eukprot:TRINITY_DN8925_c0_g1_i1.p1 TRINITY_DN8925_c0_g1~~TRINITY_DN8925_c0_g1_i1.p1  ORF type:complete len:517 (-),score=153.83 TRINITY_DN8925_c0_g1_i1:14-1417(-)
MAPHGFLPPIDQAGGSGRNSTFMDTERQERIEELVETLECPVCLDTADTPPIYQCPEGHLVCEDCNAKMVECPQCGHSLMNARNRTAEALAVKLTQLRGDRVKSILPSQALLVTVGNPQKVGKGLFAYVAYRIETKVGQEAGSKNEYTVYRRFQDFLQLHAKLVHNYTSCCIIIPPPPQKNTMATVRTKLTGETETNGLGKYIGVRCRDLDRYMKRLARHPTIRKDPDFRIFLQEVKLSGTLEVKTTIGQSITATIDRWNNKTNKYLVTDNDSWFKTRDVQQTELKKQMKQLQTDIKQMSREKMSLFVATTTFRRNLVNLLGSGGREKAAVSHSANGKDQSTNILNKVADFQNVMADLYLQQAEADELLFFLAIDYQRLLESVDTASAERRHALKHLMKETKKHGGEKGEADLTKVEEAQTNFDKLNQTMRRELEHFDKVMKEEFGDTFDKYHKQYRTALANTGNTP